MFQYVYLNLIIVIILSTIPCITYAIRCTNDHGNCVITDSDTKYELLLCCGEPEFVEQGTRLVGDYFVDVEQYIYDCRGFIQRVSIQGGNITNIETLSRGRGTHRCY